MEVSGDGQPPGVVKWPGRATETHCKWDGSLEERWGGTLLFGCIFAQCCNPVPKGYIPPGVVFVLRWQLSPTQMKFNVMQMVLPIFYIVQIKMKYIWHLIMQALLKHVILWRGGEK